MNYSKNRLAVLLLEDNQDHAAQIIERLGENFNVVNLATLNEDQLLDFKALNPTSQICIADLHLDVSKDPNPTHGLKQIRDRLWLIDRTTFFVIYSAYIGDLDLPKEKRLEPHMAFVNKKFVEGTETLREDSLNNLWEVFSSCIDASSPAMETPNDDPTKYYGYIVNFINNYKNNEWSQNYTKYYKGILHSITYLNNLRKATEIYARAGQRSSYLSIGVFGSCGRLELRKESDIECSVYYTDRGSPKLNKPLAVAFWNRVTHYIATTGRRFEGQERVYKTKLKLLSITDAKENLENEFCELIKIEILLGADADKTPSLAKKPHYRNRHLQLLTEFRPVFNEEIIYGLKREILQKYIGSTRDKWAVLNSPYFEDIMTQFILDTQPTQLRTLSDYKRFLFRIMNVLATKLMLIDNLHFGELEFENDEDWKEFFCDLCDPGLIKIIRFANKVAAAHKADPEYEILKRCLGEAIESYLFLSLRFGLIGSEDEVTNLVTAVADTTTKIFTVFETLANLSEFKIIHDQAKWLFSKEQVESTMGRLAWHGPQK